GIAVHGNNARRHEAAAKTGQASLVEPLTPELALIDPELAETARTQLTDPREPVSRLSSLQQPARPKPSAPPRPMRPFDAWAGRRRVARGRIGGGAVLAVFALAGALAAAAALWARSETDSSKSARSGRIATPTQPERLLQSSAGERHDPRTT